jgi:DNA mismatch repair protein MutS2
MTDKTLSYLDYLKLLDIIKSYSLTPFAKESISLLRPLDSLPDIESRQDKIEAVMELVSWEGKLPLTDIPDIRGILKRISIKDAVLEEKEFLGVTRFLRACADLSIFLKNAFNKKPFVEEILSQLKPLTSVYRRIAKTINIEGFIEDTASYELSKIRSDLFTFRERIRKRLEKIMEREAVKPVLQDVYIALRNGRYVIPLKPNFNEIFQGIVHDYSHSLKTSFVEPIEVVELNNAINILENGEKEEENKILRELTFFLQNATEALELDLDVVKKMDLYHSLANFSVDFNCIRPLVAENGLLEIKNARNPFIALSKKTDTVPIDILMEGEKNAMIISGPNAGGKTAALKTIGLLALMAQSGFYIPATGSPVVPKFLNIFAIIGDEQDIAMELSSFTAHMNTIKDLYVLTRGGELILIDEIGGNTEPQEASALSMGVIDAFVEKGCKVVVTTHLNLLKAYGYTKPFAINVATAFDTDTMRPMYKLLYGTAGYSNAINVAKNIRVPKEIIDRSYEYLGKQEYMLNDLISALELGKNRVEEDLEELRHMKEDLKKRLSLVKEQRSIFLKKVEEKCEAKLDELEKELEEVRKELVKKERTSLNRGKERLKDLQEKFTRNIPKSRDVIHVGDYVKVSSLGSIGHVVGEDKDGKAFEIVIGNVRTTVDSNLLEIVPKPKGVSEKSSIQVHAEKVPTPEIKVIGMRVEEALKEIDKFLDRAIVQEISQVKIVHGIGTGRLMNAIREHLEDMNYIKGIKRDGTNAGVTIIELT